MKYQNFNNQLFNLILDKSISPQLFEQIINKSSNAKIFESILREARLQEMAQLQIKHGIHHIINMIKGNIDSIKQRITHILTRGGKEGVLFFDGNGNKVSVEKWFSIILNTIKNYKVNDIDIRYKEKTYIQIPEYKKRIEIIEHQYPIIINFARQNGWAEGKYLTDIQVEQLREKMENELNLSIIK